MFVFHLLFITRDALFFFLLLIDVVKACALAHWSLSCSVRNAAEVESCISQGMAVLGPAITLDTVIETLVIGIGTLSGNYLSLYFPGYLKIIPCDSCKKKRRIRN